MFNFQYLHNYKSYANEMCLRVPSLNKANLRDLIAATSLVILLKLDSNRRFFSPCDLEIWWMTRKIIGHLFYTTSSFVHHFKSISEFQLELQSGDTQCGSKLTTFVPYDLEIWMDDLEQGKSEGFDSWDRPSNLTQTGFKSSIFQPVWPWNLMDDPKKQ